MLFSQPQPVFGLSGLEIPYSRRIHFGSCLFLMSVRGFGGRSLNSDHWHSNSFNTKLGLGFPLAYGLFPGHMEHPLLTLLMILSLFTPDLVFMLQLVTLLQTMNGIFLKITIMLLSNSRIHSIIALASTLLLMI